MCQDKTGQTDSKEEVESLHLSLHSDYASTHVGVHTPSQNFIPEFLQVQIVIQDALQTLASHCPAGRAQHTEFWCVGRDLTFQDVKSGIPFGEYLINLLISLVTSRESLVSTVVLMVSHIARFRECP